MTHISLEIKILIKQWQLIQQPFEVVWTDGRVLKRLLDGWTSLMRKLIWEKLKLPCSFGFKGHVVERRGVFFKSIVFCTLCGTSVTRIYENFPTNHVLTNSVLINVITKNTIGIPYNHKKIKLQKTEKEKVEKILLRKTPLEFRRDMARSDME